MRNPTVMYTAQSEVRKEFMTQMKVTEEGISKLGYLHWVVAETLRLHPSTPLLLPRECRETCQVMGYDQGRRQAPGHPGRGPECGPINFKTEKTTQPSSTIARQPVTCGGLAWSGQPLPIWLCPPTLVLCHSPHTPAGRRRRQRTISAPSTRLPTSRLWSFPTPATIR